LQLFVANEPKSADFLHLNSEVKRQGIIQGGAISVVDNNDDDVEVIISAVRIKILVL
jgi:uncharacterized protein YajQ (UPF0234 family)